MALKRGIVALEEYNENWNEDYRKEAEVLKDVLGDFVIEIHHVGSTSIKGLSANPIIDILLVIDSFDNINKVESILINYGYTNMGKQGIEDRYFFPKGADDARTHYVHIVDSKGDTYYNQLLFRDYLNEHPEYVKKFCDLKQDLADKYADNRRMYTACKSDFISDVIRIARIEYGIK